MDDRLAYGAQRPAATKHYLTDALDATLAGKPVAVAQAEALGCIVNFPERDRRDAHAKVSYSERIAPLLADRCASCHRDGGVAPWAMNGYDKVRGFAPMIREVIRTKRMPPWHADPHFGSFVGDRSISNEDAKTLVHWIEAGAPRKSRPARALDTQWSVDAGQPDLIVEVPAYEVPATGVVITNIRCTQSAGTRRLDTRDRNPSRRPFGSAPRAGGIDNPGNASGAPMRPNRRTGGYAPGKNAALYPAGCRNISTRGGGTRFQMHYTPSGRRLLTYPGQLLPLRQAAKHALEMAMIGCALDSGPCQRAVANRC
jgi:mono/diheme cytochrome c family protein